MMLIQMESHGPTAPAHETLKDDITKSHETEEKPLNCVPRWQHIAILIIHTSSRSIQTAAHCDMMKQIGAYENINNPEKEGKGKNLA